MYIDDKEIGTTPVENYKLLTGTHTLKVTKEGYSPFLLNITINPGEELKITANLSPIYAFINVYSNIVGANVYLDGRYLGETPLKRHKITPGNHTLEVKASGHKVFSQTIVIRPQENLTINAKLLPLSSTLSTTSSYLTTNALYISSSYIPYAGTLFFLFLVLIAIRSKKRRKKLQIPTFPPQLLKKYEPLEFLGEGGFAKVFKVKRKKDKKIVALKVFPADEKAKKFFTKEVRAWKLLDHPNIVKLYNAFDKPIPHLEIEFVEGYTMDGKLIRDLEHYPKPVDEKLALKFIEGIAEGLRHAHSMQVYHRDLKPSNILLKGDLTPKITDFGLAKIGSKSTTTTTKALTPLYAAPEQIDERTYGHTDHRTDIYQLGVILYELLTGKLPYEGSSHVVVLAKITTPEIKPKPPSMYNLTLAKYDKMFGKLLAKQKEKRYQSLDEFLEEFRGLVELLKEREKLKESLRVTKETITKTRDELEVKKLNSELLRLLIQNTILSARINDKEEVLNALYDLIPFTRKYRAELEEAIRQVQLFIEEGLVIPEGFIDSLRILLHKIEKEA
ncbi:PEGA domain-containing protein [Thermococcus indicus]|uniref:PEGA domain-containing protein n=1 Tax=Thermococcus indicus TaxID=2586643 RepID=A0A4Y5SN55_9EURY|nr:protein kinase [Thermococcus indicus]QDA31592.1 PEGA domain-containing protein [Thermococcus indicus]